MKIFRLLIWLFFLQLNFLLLNVQNAFTSAKVITTNGVTFSGLIDI